MYHTRAGLQLLIYIVSNEERKNHTRILVGPGGCVALEEHPGPTYYANQVGCRCHLPPSYLASGNTVYAYRLSFPVCRYWHAWRQSMVGAKDVIASRNIPGSKPTWRYMGFRGLVQIIIRTKANQIKFVDTSTQGEKRSRHITIYVSCLTHGRYIEDAAAGWSCCCGVDDRLSGTACSYNMIRLGVVCWSRMPFLLTGTACVTNVVRSTKARGDESHELAGAAPLNMTNVCLLPDWIPCVGREHVISRTKSCAPPSRQQERHTYRLQRVQLPASL